MITIYLNFFDCINQLQLSMLLSSFRYCFCQIVGPQQTKRLLFIHRTIFICARSDWKAPLLWKRCARIPNKGISQTAKLTL